MSIRTPESRVHRVRHDLRRRALHLVHVDHPTPGFAALTLHGEDLADFVSLSFDDHVKLLLPTPDGELRRDLTPRRFDLAARTLVLEVALGHAGPVADWARAARVGDRVDVGGPRGSMVIAPDHDWHLLAGDATALPAIARRTEELAALAPAARVVVLGLVSDPADRRALHGPAGLQVHWTADAAGFLAALHALPLPAGDGFAWAAGENALMKATRETLLRQHRLDPAALRVSAYWKRGQADHHEHF